MCMPAVDEAFFLDAMRELIRLEADWVPHSEGTSLYIRPTMIANEPMLGVRPADQYLCYVILSPVGAYYKGGIAPVKIWISDHYVRAAEGGTGEAKTGGNYAASLYASREAAANGYDQVLWLDAKEKKYIEEVGSMNMVFVYDGKIVTSPLKGTVLDGITRRSVLTLCKEMGLEIEERALTVDEVLDDRDSPIAVFGQLRLVLAIDRPEELRVGFGEVEGVLDEIGLDRPDVLAHQFEILVRRLLGRRRQVSNRTEGQ